MKVNTYLLELRFQGCSIALGPSTLLRPCFVRFRKLLPAPAANRKLALGEDEQLVDVVGSKVRGAFATATLLGCWSRVAVAVRVGRTGAFLPLLVFLTSTSDCDSRFEPTRLGDVGRLKVRSVVFVGKRDKARIDVVSAGAGTRSKRWIEWRRELVNMYQLTETKKAIVDSYLVCLS
jgi:hypothetical protein